MDALWPSTSRLRFSLRELLLLTLAVGAFLGWGLLLYKTYQPHRVTPFLAQHYEWAPDIAAIREKLNETGPVVNMDFAGYPGRSSYYQEISYRFTLSPANGKSFMDALSDRMRQAISESGCEPYSSRGTDEGCNQVGSRFSVGIVEDV